MRTLYRNGRLPGGGTALLVDGSRIAWTGSDGDAPGAERTVDLNGAAVLPAFVDAHVHATATGLALTGLDLHGTRSLGEALDRVARHADARRGRVVLGTGWDDTRWPERRPPTRPELDRAAFGGAVYLARVDVHSAVCSSALLAAVPEVRALAGYAESGHLRLDAHHAVRRAAYTGITPGQRRAAQQATLHRAAALGVGCVQEMAGPEVSGEADLSALLELASAEPGPDVLAYWGQLHAVDVVAEWGLAGAGGDLFCDGAFGSHTAAVSRPYADAPTNGALRFADDEVRAHLRAATAAGVQAGFHVIGDAAIAQVVEAAQAVGAELGREQVRACRHRLEHVEMPTPLHIAAMAELGMVASVQPAFDAAWGGPQSMYAERLGADRAAELNPFAAFARAGVPLALGSDAPVTPLDPWGGIAAAVRHRTAGSGITLAAAFAAATTGGWQAARADEGHGTLRVGAPATFAGWDGAGDLPGLFELAVAGERPSCLTMVVRGRLVHDREGNPG